MSDYFEVILYTVPVFLMGAAWERLKDEPPQKYFVFLLFLCIGIHMLFFLRYGASVFTDGFFYLTYLAIIVVAMGLFFLEKKLRQRKK